MRISRVNFWKLTTFILLGLVLFVGNQFLKEYKKNLPYKKELSFLKKNLIQAEKENLFYQKQILSLNHPLTLEKERKNKFGESLEDETIIIISDDVLKNMHLPIFK